MSGPRNPLSNMAHASDVVAAVLHGIVEQDSAPKQFIKTHPGKGQSTLKFGMPRLIGRAADLGMSLEAQERIEREVCDGYDKASKLCESPIERSMLAALLTGDWGDIGAIPPAVHDSTRGSSEMLPKCPVVIAPQLALFRFRLDFGVVIAKRGHLQIVAVECDGHDFHQDAIKEAGRVAYLNSWNIPVFKFTGSDLHDDAIRAADKVITGIHQWWEA